jgi:hypothetical protein
MNEVLRAYIPPGIVACTGLFLTLLVMAKDTPEEKVWKFWRCSAHALFRSKALAIIVIEVVTKGITSAFFGEQGNAWGDLIMNLNSAIAGAYAAKGWLGDTASSPSTPPATATLLQCPATRSPSITLTDETDSAGNRKIAFTYQVSKADS